jgi:outer membrane protein assembly factor BamA
LLSFLLLIALEITCKNIYTFDISFFLAMVVFSILFLFFRDEVLPYLGTIIYFSLFVSSLLTFLKKNKKAGWMISFSISFLLSFILMPKIWFIFAPIFVTVLTVIINRCFYKKSHFLFALFLIAFFTLPNVDVSAQELFIKEIKVLSGYQSNPQIILNYLTLREGQIIDSSKLKQELNRAIYRLIETGFVNSVNMHTVPNELNKNEIKIIIELKDEKDSWIFGAGYLYLTVGKINLNGEGKYWLAYAGSNFNGFSYFDPLFSKKNNLSLTSGMFNYYSNLWQRQINSSVVELRKKINPYFFIGNKISLDTSTADDQIVGLSLYHYWNDFDSLIRPTEGLLYRSDLEFFRDFNQNRNFFRISTGGQKIIPLINNIVYEFKSYFGTSSTMPSVIKLYNIAHIDGLRGGLETNWLGSNYFVLSNELIYPRSKNSLLEGVFFIDVGRTWLPNENISLENLNTCYGAGLRGYISPPININFRLEYGISQINQGILYYSIWQSF